MTMIELIFIKKLCLWKKISFICYFGGMKMKIGIIGVGIQGQALAMILSRIRKNDSLVVIDNNSQNIQVTMKGLKNVDIEGYCIDVNDTECMEEKLYGCEILYDMLTPEFAVTVMELALKIHAHYINTAFDVPYWTAILNNEKFPLQDEFEAAGLIALMGCGDSPGLVNVFIRKYCDKLDTVRDIKIYGAYKKNSPDIFNGWNPGWSVKQAYLDFVTKPVVYRNGCFVKLHPFSEREWRNIHTYGMKELSLHSHEECYSLPRTIRKGIQNCEFKYEIDTFAAVLYSCGFRLGEQIEIENCKVSSISCLMNVLENADTNTVFNDDDEYCSTIEIVGTAGQQEHKYTIALPPLYNDREHTMKIFGTLKIDVALPAAIAMCCLNDVTPGIHFAEELNPEHFENILRQYIPYKEIMK